MSDALTGISLPAPSTSPRMRDHIFVSYAHTDRALVERLVQDLRERGHTVWIDFESIQGGDSMRSEGWQKEILMV
jgi:hypothetical protein